MCRDNLSGLSAAADANVALSTSVPDGTETSNASTNSQSVCDVAGNCATAGPVSGNRIDKKAPTISITLPTASTYLLRQVVSTDYACADAGSGTATCAGPVAAGGVLDTASVGSRSFAVAATDNVGHTAAQGVNYQVAYAICALYDSVHPFQIGATIPIRLQLCDANGSNVSSALLGVTAIGVRLVSSSISDQPLQAPSAANPDSNFRFDPTLGATGGYIYNLSTRGLASGTYELQFSAANDPTTHSVPFGVK